MIKKIKALALVLVMSLTVVITGCGKEEKEHSGDYLVSYLDREQTHIVREEYDIDKSSLTQDAIIDELCNKLTETTNNLDQIKAVPDGVEIVNKELSSNGVLNIYFNEAYQQMDAVREILCRLALVQTLTQVDGVRALAFFVDGEPLIDNKGYSVGIMTPESFVENPGEQINSIQRAEIKLYFANMAGNGLVAETQEVYYSSNVSMEKLVVEHLIKGPVSGNLQGTIPTGTTLVNVSVADRVCYVNLDEAFKVQNYEIMEPVVIYSIVNSLTHLSYIDKVQISINGDTSGNYRDSMDLSMVYEYDEQWIGDVDSMPDVIVNDVDEATASEM